MFALVDCNSCYASCEQIFRPDLRGKPVVVLSNNDGCIVARSAEAKCLGIPDLQPYFKLAPKLKALGVQVFSSNYALYGDISRRVMEMLSGYSPEVEVYSIDEMFLNLNGITTGETEALRNYGMQIKAKLWQDIRMPVGVGIGPTKTLAKLANYAAKKIPKLQGVCVLDAPHKWQWLQERLPVKQVWGVGSRIARRLNEQGVSSIADLCCLSPKRVRKQFGVTLERTLRELNGEVCIALETAPSAKQQIFCTRSFGEKVYALDDLIRITSVYVCRAAEKLRVQNAVTAAVQVFIHTSRHSAPYYHNSATVRLLTASSDTRVLQKAVRKILMHLYRPGFAYAKSGVGLLGLTACKYQQSDLFTSGDSLRDRRLMQCMDRINLKYGRNSVHLASNGACEQFSMRQQLLSPRYTSCWRDIPKVKC